MEFPFCHLPPRIKCFQKQGDKGAQTNKKTHSTYLNSPKGVYSEYMCYLCVVLLSPKTHWVKKLTALILFRVVSFTWSEHIFEKKIIFLFIIDFEYATENG